MMKKNKSESIRAHLLRPLLLLLVIQAIVMAAVVLFGGVSIKLKDNAVHLLRENTENSRLYLERVTLHQWINIINTSGAMAPEIQSVLDAEGKTASDIGLDSELNQHITDKIMEKSIDLLRRSNGTGIFVILDGPAAENSPEGIQAGFYVRDSKAGGYSQNYSSILMERGHPSSAGKYGIGLDSFWELGFDVAEDRESNAYYRKPFDSARENQSAGVDPLNFTYLSHPFRLSPEDIPVITYSVPIVLEDGSVVGVFGLESTVGSMEQVLGTNQITSVFNQCYVVGIRQAGQKDIEPVFSFGSLYNQYFAGRKVLNYEDIPRESIGVLTSDDGTKWYSDVRQIEVYNHNTPFDHDEWVLVGMARRHDFLKFYNSIRGMLVGSLAIPVIFSLLGVFIIGKVVTEPIRNLVKEVRAKSGVHGLSLKRVHISEIDELSETIEQLSSDVERSASRVTGIIEHANVLIGVFEYQKEQPGVFCSQSVFDMLGWEPIEEPYGYLPRMEFETLIYETMKGGKPDGSNYLCCLEKNGVKRYIRLVLDQRSDGVSLGVLTDVTADVMEKEKLERERNYDLLTNLYNRRAFREQLVRVIENTRPATAALAMWDLDNLKYINDTYGHDEGDRYIVLFANCLKELEEEGAVVSRYSGDEFVTFLYGGEGREEIRLRLRRFMEKLKVRTLEVKGGYQIPVRVSGGVAWYPDDSMDFDILLNYADFAMYTVKNSVKGIVMEFDSEEYSDNSYMLAGREELNRMLETKEVRFAFQPIVTRTGDVYGYEILMRPDFANLKGVGEVLNLARAQAKLHQIENLTWYAGLKEAAHQDQLGTLGKDTRLFLNSIASVCMTQQEVEEIENQFAPYLSRIVMEMTEGEPVNNEYMNRKISIARRWNGLIAIDDFGTGYNGEGVLLDMRPDIIKIDMSLVQHINQDSNRQMLLKSLMDFAKQNNMSVLAEGVEAPEDLKYLIQAGVHLFQGYYIARPQLEIRPIDPYIIQKMKEFA